MIRKQRFRNGRTVGPLASTSKQLCLKIGCNVYTASLVKCKKRMRRFRILLPVVLLAFLVVSCRKDSPKTPSDPKAWIDPTPGTITGKWELYQTYGGMSPLTTHAPGNGFELHFDNANYRMYGNGQLRQAGTYKVLNDSVINVQTCQLEAPESSAPNRLVYDNETVVRNGFTATKNSLTITAGCIPLDGGVAIYRRIENGAD
jgi:hypothetical protein